MPPGVGKPPWIGSTSTQHAFFLYLFKILISEFPGFSNPIFSSYYEIQSFQNIIDAEIERKFVTSFYKNLSFLKIKESFVTLLILLWIFNFWIFVNTFLIVLFSFKQGITMDITELGKDLMTEFLFDKNSSEIKHIKNSWYKIDEISNKKFSFGSEAFKLK